jgi:hypothetical protein
MAAEGIHKVDLWTARYRMTRVGFAPVEIPAGHGRLTSVNAAQLK